MGVRFPPSLFSKQMVNEIKKFLIAVSILVGTCIGAGVLGIPYVASQSGFVAALGYILILGLIILIVNLYIGEIALRTKGDHQLIGYARKYLGKRWKHVMEFAVVFGTYAAIIAYMIGMGESLSFLFTGATNYGIYFGLGVGVLMAFLIKGGLKSLKRFEKWGVLIILLLLATIFILFVGKIHLPNLATFNSTFIFLPFGVVLFALMSFHAIPEVKLVLKGSQKLFKRVLLTGTLISVVFYILFTLVVLGYLGANTPEIATLSLGMLFIVLGILTMFTSYLASGNALIENFQFDERYSENVSWFFAAIIPIGIYLIIQVSNIFSFITVLSIGGVVAGGITAIVVLLMVRKAKIKGNRIPEYSISAYKWILGIIGLIFVFGVVREIFLVIG